MFQLVTDVPAIPLGSNGVELWNQPALGADLRAVYGQFEPIARSRAASTWDARGMWGTARWNAAFRHRFV